MSDDLIWVTSHKYDKRPHYRFPLRRLRWTANEIVAYGEYGRRVQHFTRGLDLAVENESIDFYFPGQPFTVAAGFDRERVLQYYYCNVILPLEVEGEAEIRYVDMDLDLVVQPDLTWRVDDEDEFEAHSALYGYPSETVAQARAALGQLIRKVQEKEYPFDGTAIALLANVRRHLSDSEVKAQESRRPPAKKYR